jgi:hypothetical protein
VPEDEYQCQHRQRIEKDADREPALVLGGAPQAAAPDPRKQVEVEGERREGHERGLRPRQETEQEREAAHRDVDQLPLGFAGRQAGQRTMLGAGRRRANRAAAGNSFRNEYEG